MQQQPNEADDYWAGQSWAAYYERVTEIPGPEKTVSFLSELPQGARVLDFGCGNVRWAKAFLRDRPDLVIDLLDRCLHEAPDIPVPWPGEQYHLAFQDFVPTHRYNGIWAFNSLFFLRTSALRDVLHRLAKSLAPGGTFVFTMVDVCEGSDYFRFHGMEKDALVTLLDSVKSWRLASLKTVDRFYGVEKKLAPTHLVALRGL